MITCYALDCIHSRWRSNVFGDAGFVALDYIHSHWRSNVFEDVRFWFCPNLIKFCRNFPNYPNFAAMVTAFL